MRIHDQIRTNTLLAEWHILLVDDQTANTLLAVARTKLIADFRTTALAQLYLNELTLI